MGERENAHTECREWGADRGWPVDEHGICLEFCGNDECIRYGPVIHPELVPNAEYLKLCTPDSERCR